MAVGTGLEPRRHGRRLAGALRRESEAGVLVAWKESGARAGSQHPLPLQGPRMTINTISNSSNCVSYLCNMHGTVHIKRNRR